MQMQQLVRTIDPEHLARAADVIKLLGHPERLKIVEVLEERRETTVTDIQETLDLPQAIASQHLAKLRGAGVVTARRAGNHVYYRIVEPKVHHILKCLRRCDM